MVERVGRDVSSYGIDLGPRRRPGFGVRVHLCTWELVVFRIDPDDGRRPVFVAHRPEEVAAFLADLDAGRRDDDLATALSRPPSRRLRRAPRRKAELRLGVEQEYVVHGTDGVVDFRSLVDGLELGVRADPTDPHAIRCAWGGVVTTDGAEAEVATPPVAARPGAVPDVVELAARGRGVVEEALGSDHRLEGYSTHLNISAPRRGDVRRATVFARVFAPSLMLLLDRHDSPGLLVRPRPGRLELGGEFCDGDDLGVALTFALGAVLASGGRYRRHAERLAVEVDLRPAVERFGWYVDRRAFGCDLYELGRDAPLQPGGSSATLTAGAHLERTWELARSAIGNLLAEDERALVDAVVGGSAPLPRG